MNSLRSEGGERLSDSFMRVSSESIGKDTAEKTSHKFLDGLKKYAIIPLNLLPFSSRSVASNVLSAPIRLAQSLYLGIKEAVQDRSVKPVVTETTSTAKEKLQAGWKGGITDSYTDLSADKNRELGKEIAKENLKYAGYLRKFHEGADGFERFGAHLNGDETLFQGDTQVNITWQGRLISENLRQEPELQKENSNLGQSQVVEEAKQSQVSEDSALSTSDDDLEKSRSSNDDLEQSKTDDGLEQPKTSDSELSISDDEQPKAVVNLHPTMIDSHYILTFQPLIDDVKAMGFQEDSRGHFYHVETGTIFSMIYDQTDKDKPEVVFAFDGLGAHDHLKDVDKDTKATIAANGDRGAYLDFFGGIPQSTLQAIELGAKLKAFAENNGFKPIVVGHSHGGGLAQCAAAANGVKCVAFNSRPVGPAVRRYIGKEKVTENSKNMLVFAGEGDSMTRNKATTLLAILTERVLGWRVPRSLGEGYNLPAGDDPDEDRRPQHWQFYSQLKRVLKIHGESEVADDDS